jgi:hypothetical protein
LRLLPGGHALVLPINTKRRRLDMSSKALYIDVFYATI